MCIAGYCLNLSYKNTLIISRNHLITLIYRIDRLPTRIRQRPLLDTEEDLAVVNEMATHRVRVARKESGGETDEEEGQDDEVSERLDIRQEDDEGELYDVHEHVEGMLDSVHDPSLPLPHVLLHQLRHGQVGHPQTYT